MLEAVVSAASLDVSDDLAERLRAEGQACGLRPSDLAAVLLREGPKTRQFPGVVYRDGPTGRRASLADGPDVWQVVRALQEVPPDEHDPVGMVCVEADLSVRQVRLAMQFYEAYPGEVDAKIADNHAAAARLDAMISEREQAIARGQ